MEKDSKEYLLVQDGDESDDGHIYQSRSSSNLGSKLKWTSLVLLALSILLNICLVMKMSILKTALDTRGRSKYAGLEFSERILYHTETEYSHKNETYAEELWETIDTNPVAITLSYEYARENDLLEPRPFPWDESKGLFYINGFHQLHCLKLIKRSLSEYRLDLPQTLERQHISHCLDALRQNVLCAADDTPMPTLHSHATGDNQAMQCRSWDKLIEWARDPEKDACYRIVDEYKDPVHNLERFAYCSEDSRYYETMTNYFAKWGHKNLFDD
ncbi:uncharacterized protein LY89DRAFT_688748 [Mollisia scopiformis]|uniref:Uncharacterized protein n=1 Tax=Mollisia scopiformis TaxID=149040 RepID=A0A194WV95_MOLSC|nr:uncharacterized protein LY89DRAFT_688748 [Mollisia scopiformis]KUJ11512.1 hypothetical protein LY89DRAFT_688748 [Mollisia scopiformis]